MSSRLDDLASAMFDLLAGSPDQVHRDDIIASLGIVDVGEFHFVKGRLQDLLGEGDSINVVGEPREANSGWWYSLEGDPTSTASVLYMAQKERQVFARQKRAWMIVNSLCRATDGRTAPGRVARRQRESIRRSLLDTLDAMVEVGVTDLPKLPEGISVD